MSQNRQFRRQADTTVGDGCDDGLDEGQSNGGIVLDQIPVTSRTSADPVVFLDRTNRLSLEGKQRRNALDANRYATKKTIAQGMLDVALLTANASQLKYVLQLGSDKHPFYTLMLSLITVSIVLQIVVGVLFLAIGGMNINEKPNQKVAGVINDAIVLVILLITLLNIIISGFGISAQDTTHVIK